MALIQINSWCVPTLLISQTDRLCKYAFPRLLFLLSQYLELAAIWNEEMMNSTSSPFVGCSHKEKKNFPKSRKTTLESLQKAEVDKS